MGAFKADYDRMAVPVTGDEEKDAKVAKQSLKRTTLYPDTRLFFAGEATHRRGSGYFRLWVLCMHYLLATTNHEPRTMKNSQIHSRRICSPLFIYIFLMMPF